MRRTQPYSKWDHYDFALIEAYQIFESEISSSSGLPVWLTRSLDPNIGFEIETRIDIADAMLESWDKKHGGDKRAPGLSRMAVPVALSEGEPLPLVYGGLNREQFVLAAGQATRDAEEYEDEDENLGPIQRHRPVGGYNPADYGDGLTTPAP